MLRGIFFFSFAFQRVFIRSILLSSSNFFLSFRRLKLFGRLLGSLRANRVRRWGIFGWSRVAQVSSGGEILVHRRTGSREIDITGLRGG